MALASSGDPEFADEALDDLDIRDDVAMLKTSEDVDGSKPEPDMIEVTLEAVGTRRAVLVGDTPYDVQSAERAGLKCIGLRSGGYSEAELAEAGAVLVVDAPEDLIDLDWEQYLPDPPAQKESMTSFGYTLMTEQTGPRELVDHAVRAEGAGFDFEVMSDHYFPWLSAQGHAPYAWSVLGAVAHATERVGLMTYVTCPTIRYHPAVVAQKAATVQLLAEGRFTLGLGSGENLNEHVVGQGWPARQRPPGDAARGDRDHPRAAHRRAGRPPGRVLPGRLGAHLGPARAAGRDRRGRRRRPGDRGAGAAGRPPGRGRAGRGLSRSWNGTDGAPKIGERARAIGQIPICWDPDEDTAVERAHEQFRWFAGGWSVNADLPTTAGFAGATQFVRPEDVADNIPCGPDLDAIVEGVRPFWEAGFTDVALVQIGGDTQEQFLAEVAGPLLEKLRNRPESDASPSPAILLGCPRQVRTDADAGPSSRPCIRGAADQVHGTRPR